MDTLSSETLELILEFLPPTQVMKARCVCLRWKNLCERIVRRRDRAGGPFIAHKGHPHTTLHNVLPVFQMPFCSCLSFPSVARAGKALYLTALLAPFARAKLTHLMVSDVNLRPHLLNARSLPRLTHLEFSCFSRRRLQSVTAALPWPGIQRLYLSNFIDDEATPAAFPSCSHLSLNRVHVAPGQIEAWPLRQLDVHNGSIWATDLAHGIRVLHLWHAAVHLRAANLFADTRAQDFWPEHRIGDAPAEVSCALACPALETLVASKSGSVHLGLCTPRLTSLTLYAPGPRVLKKAIAHLQSLSLRDMVTGDLDWLAAQPLRVLCLEDVELVPGLGFLAQCATLEMLKISRLAMPPQAVPFAGLVRLTELRLDMHHDAITNVADIGAIATLERLSLCHVPGLPSVVFLRPLARLRRLKLFYLPALQTLDGVQHLPALTWLTVAVHADGQALQIDALAGLQCIQKLKLRGFFAEKHVSLTLGALDLRRLSAATVLVLQNIVCTATPMLPPGLRVLRMNTCWLETDPHSTATLTCVRALAGLRHLRFELRGAAISPGWLMAEKQLLSLDLEIGRVESGAFEYLRAQDVSVNLYEPEHASASLREVARLAPVSLIAIVQRSPDVDVWSLFAPSLRALGLFMHERVLPGRPLGLAALTGLERLHLSMEAGPGCLAELAGHPALRELVLMGSGPLDIAPLLTCARLAEVDLGAYEVSPPQMAALRALLDAQVQ